MIIQTQGEHRGQRISKEMMVRKRRREHERKFLPVRHHIEFPNSSVVSLGNMITVSKITNEDIYSPIW